MVRGETINEILSVKKVSVEGNGKIGTPVRGEEIYVRKPLYVLPTLNYGDAFIVWANVKNTGNVRTSYRVWSFLKDLEGSWLTYAYYGRTDEIDPGNEVSIPLSVAAPGAYLIRIPAFASYSEVNPVRVDVWDDKQLASRQENAFYASPVGAFSIGYITVTFCKGVDSSYNPINPTDTFSSDERLYFYVKTYYDSRGYRHTCTWQTNNNIPWTGYYDVPGGYNYDWYAVWWYVDPPLPKGTWTVWYRVAGNYCVKKVATIS